MKIDTASGSRGGDLEQPSVTNNPSKHRYEIQIGSEVVGFAAYELVGDSVMFTHTEIDSMYDGRGYGGMLARLAIEDVRMQAKHVIPMCPFIAAFIRRHPEYLDLVRSDFRVRLKR